MINLLHVVQGLIIHPDTNQVLMAYRLPDKAKPCLWEYPGGKVEGEETFEQALKRELKEELDIDVLVGHRIARAMFRWKNDVAIYLFVIDHWIGEPKPLEAAEIKWVDPDFAIDRMPLHPMAFVAYREAALAVQDRKNKKERERVKIPT